MKVTVFMIIVGIIFLIVNLNLRDGDKPIALSKGNGSDIETFGSPKSTTSFEVVLFSLYALFNRCRA